MTDPHIETHQISRDLIPAYLYRHRAQRITEQSVHRAVYCGTKKGPSLLSLLITNAAKSLMYELGAVKALSFELKQGEGPRDAAQIIKSFEAPLSMVKQFPHVWFFCVPVSNSFTVELIGYNPATHHQFVVDTYQSTQTGAPLPIFEGATKK